MPQVRRVSGFDLNRFLVNFHPESQLFLALLKVLPLFVPNTVGEEVEVKCSLRVRYIHGNTRVGQIIIHINRSQLLSCKHVRNAPASKYG